MGSLDLKRECGASLNARKHVKEKNSMSKNLHPKHCPKRLTSTSEINVCRFKGGLKVACLES